MTMIDEKFCTTSMCEFTAHFDEVLLKLRTLPLHGRLWFNAYSGDSAALCTSLQGELYV